MLLTEFTEKPLLYHYKIKKPTQQLIDMFVADQTQKFCLYCHFKNKPPLKWKLKLEDLEKILGNEANNYPTYLKKDFLNNFFIQFSEDYETQFSQAIELIKLSFSLADDSKAYLYHSLLRSKLFDISIKSISERKISRKDFNRFVNDAEKTIFYKAYSKYLDKSKYERLVKKEFFTFKVANIENFERLFVIQCDRKKVKVELSKIIQSLSNKYYKAGKSPQPYVCFRNLDPQEIIALKKI